MAFSSSAAEILIMSDKEDFHHGVAAVSPDQGASTGVHDRVSMLANRAHILTVGASTGTSIRTSSSSSHSASRSSIVGMSGLTPRY